MHGARRNRESSMKYQLHFDHIVLMVIGLILIIVLWYLIDNNYLFIFSSLIVILIMIVGLLFIDDRERKWDNFTRDFYG
jgi:membrane protein YdbS with pleckstrin-like domain